MHGQMHAREKREVMARFAVGRGRRAGRDERDRGRHRRPERDRDGDRGGRPLRHLAAAPAARPGRAAGRTSRTACCSRTRARSWRARRLEAVAAERDGFRLAEVDLTLRGEGDVLGTRQHGLPEFRVARLPEDAELLERARAWSIELLRADPELADPEHALLRVRARAPLRRARGRADRGLRHRARRRRRIRGPAPRRARAARRTRPTPDRVREALFSMLGPVDGLRVLDLYAGSGALGIEALSRGAREATFVDSDAAAAAGGAREPRARRARTRRACSAPTRCLPARRRPPRGALGLGASATRHIDSRHRLGPALGPLLAPVLDPRRASFARALSNSHCDWTCR